MVTLYKHCIHIFIIYHYLMTIIPMKILSVGSKKVNIAKYAGSRGE